MNKLLIIVLSILLLSACRTNKSIGEEVIPISNDVVISIADLEKQNVALFKFIQEVNENVNTRNWDKLVGNTNQENYQIQMKDGVMTHEQYIYELLNIVRVVNGDFQTSIETFLSTIQKMTLTKYNRKTWNDSFYYVFNGRIITNSNIQYPCSIFVEEVDGSYEIYSALF